MGPWVESFIFYKNFVEIHYFRFFNSTKNTLHPLSRIETIFIFFIFNFSLFNGDFSLKLILSIIFQQTFDPSLLHNTLATQNPSSGLSGNLATGLGGNLSANLAGNLTSAFPGNVATFGNTGMANFCSSGANLMTSINNSQAQMSPSVSVTQSGMIMFYFSIVQYSI